MEKVLKFMSVNPANIRAWSLFINKVGFPVVIALIFTYFVYQQNSYNQHLIDSLRQDNKVMIETMQGVKTSLHELTVSLKN